MRVDVHSHFMPPRYVDKLGELGGYEQLEALKPYGAFASAYAAHLFPEGESAFIENWIQNMDTRDVDAMVMSVNIQPYFAEEKSAVTAARFGNEMMRDAVGMGRGRLMAFGCLPLPHAEAAVKEIEFCLDECGFAGINLGCSADGRPLDDPAFDEVWAALNDRAATVYLHAGQTPQMGVGSGDYQLGPSFGGPTEIALAMSRLVLNKVTVKYPNMRIIGACLGGSIPHFTERLVAHLQLVYRGLYEELDGVLPHLRRFWYDTGIEDTYGYEAVRRTLGVDRLVLGSDSPRMPVSDAVDRITSTDLLTEDEKAQILDHNGAKSLGLPVSA
ncbi:amidohydrolase family protein [Streptomyces sp. SID5914]|nr:amidohydrolase family protein [Streptomyces sp. SID5914]MZG20006.1 amidohydrolase family protein [Streptomyces sp. SID5914]